MRKSVIPERLDAWAQLKLKVSPHFRIRVISATREITPVLLGNPYRRRNRLWLRGTLVKRARARLTRRIRSVDYPGGIAVFRRRPLNSTPRAARRNVQSGPNPSLRPVSQVARPHKHCETAIRHIACSQTVPKVDISKGPESCWARCGSRVPLSRFMSRTCPRREDSAREWEFESTRSANSRAMSLSVQPVCTPIFKSACPRWRSDCGASFRASSNSCCPVTLNGAHSTSCIQKATGALSSQYWRHLVAATD